MEHIRQYDWLTSLQADTDFLEENDIDNCVTERILRNRFRDPLISSDSEDDVPVKIDWSQTFKRKEIGDKRHKIIVPGLRGVPSFPKLSALTTQQHLQCLKVLCQQNPKVLSMDFLHRPSKLDYRVFEEVKDVYLKEQQEFIDWAKTVWTSHHCVRALRPKPTIETVYEAEFKMRAHELASFPKQFAMAAHISLNNKDRCEIIHKQDLVNVNIGDLPKAEFPDPLVKKFTILRPCPVPEPCNKHPCWFILPNEKNMTVLPLTEIHRELAQYALDNGAQFIASEGSLKCLMEMDKDWTIPLSVCEVIDADGYKMNVFVFGSEFSIQRKSAMTRTYKAYRHLLQYALIPVSEKSVLNLESTETPSNGIESLFDNMNNMDVSSDEEEGQLIINEDDDSNMDIESQSRPEEKVNKKQNKNNKQSNNKPNSTKTKDNKTNGEKKSESVNRRKTDDFYTCSCKDSMFENPPLRSFKKWQVKNYNNNQNFNLIVHCSHKMKGQTGEVISDPIVEYQVDLGGSKQSEDKLRSLALSLFLRKNATLLNVRVDSTSGEVVRIDTISLDDLIEKQTNVIQDISSTVYETFNQLQGLLPGHYILRHEPNLGANAFLYAPRVKGGTQKLELNFDCALLAEADEADSVKTPPVLSDVLLPVHKFRKLLPCAFTPYEDQLAKEPKKPPAKAKPPPQALRWPKRKPRKNKKS